MRCINESTPVGAVKAPNKTKTNKKYLEYHYVKDYIATKMRDVAKNVLNI